MTNEEVLEVLKTTNVVEYNKEFVEEVTKKSVEYVENNGLHNVVIAYEELAELEQVITKEIRGKGNRLSAIEEIADVMLGFEFLNAVYKLNLDTHCSYSKLDEYSMFVALRFLGDLQTKILRAIDYNEIDPLKNSCITVLHVLENVKEQFSISNDEITKVKIFKINRLKSRIENETLI